MAIKKSIALFVISLLAVSTYETYSQTQIQPPVKDKVGIKKNTGVSVTINKEITSELTIAVNTAEVKDISSTGAFCTYTINSKTKVIQHGVCVNKGPSPTIENTRYFPKGDPGPTSFGADITGLSPNVKYFVRAFAKNSSGTVFYGNELSFTTLVKK